MAALVGWNQDWHSNNEFIMGAGPGETNLDEETEVDDDCRKCGGPEGTDKGSAGDMSPDYPYTATPMGESLPFFTTCFQEYCPKGNLVSVPFLVWISQIPFGYGDRHRLFKFNQETIVSMSRFTIMTIMKFTTINLIIVVLSLM